MTSAYDVDNECIEALIILISTFNNLHGGIRIKTEFGTSHFANLEHFQSQWVDKMGFKQAC